MCLDTEARLAVSIGFDNFAAAVRALLDGTAAGKGYNRTGPDGPNDLYEFVATMNDGPGHALGEIVYKARRYAARRNPEDLLKIAAWAWLIYRHHHATEAGELRRWLLEKHE